MFLAVCQGIGMWVYFFIKSLSKYLFNIYHVQDICFSIFYIFKINACITFCQEKYILAFLNNRLKDKLFKA